MPSSVSRETQCGRLSEEPASSEQVAAPAPRATVRPADSVCVAPAVEAPVGDDSTLESALRSRLGELQPADSLELSGAAGLAVGVAADFRGKLRVERDDRGFTVEVEGQLEGGAAEPGASARIGLASGTKFRVTSAAEAATSRPRRPTS